MGGARRPRPSRPRGAGARPRRGDAGRLGVSGPARGRGAPGEAVRPESPRRSRGGQEPVSRGRRPAVPSRVPVPAARAERPRRRRVHRRRAGLDGGGARARQPGGHPFRGRRLRRGPGGLPGGAPPRPARREGPLQPLPRLRRDLPDRGGAGEAHRGARARQRPRHAVPRQPDAREGRLPRVHARRGAGEGRCPAERLPKPPRPRALPRRERHPHLGRTVRRGHSPRRGRGLRPRLLTAGRGVATPSPATSAGGRSAASASRPARVRSSARSASTST